MLVLLLVAGFWAGAFHFLTAVLMRLQGMENNVGNIIALKGLSLLLMLVFFLLIFSSLLSSINNFYLSADLPVVLSSPVSWNNIFLSKWLETAFKSSWMILFAILPVFIAFGLYFKVTVYYFIVLFPVLMFFVLIPSGIGIIMGSCLVGLVPAKRARNIFVVLGLLTMGILFLLFRFLRPERFANPEWFANLTIFLSEMKLPVSAFLPSMWATETVTPFFYSRGSLSVFYPLLLFFTAAVLIVFGSWLFHAVYYNGFVKAQQSHKPWFAASEGLPAGMGNLFKGWRGALIQKDISTFVRNVEQSSQLLLLLAIVVIYLFSIKALPVDWDSFLSMKLRYIVSFFNIGIVAFVVTAVAARLVLPSVGNEGRAFWIIRVSPVTMGRFLWTKFLIAFVPLLVLAQALIIISNIFLGVEVWLMALGIATSFVLVASVTALAIGIGAYTARFSPEGTDREQSGFQGAAFMLSAFFLIVVTIMLEIFPTLSMFMKEVSKSDFTSKGWAIVSVLFLAVFSLNSLVVWLAMRMSEKRLVAME
jgi:ABC-2 type transport system permease protein